MAAPLEAPEAPAMPQPPAPLDDATTAPQLPASPEARDGRVQLVVISMGGPRKHAMLSCYERRFDFWDVEVARKAFGDATPDAVAGFDLTFVPGVLGEMACTRKRLEAHAGDVLDALGLDDAQRDVFAERWPNLKVIPVADVAVLPETRWRSLVAPSTLREATPLEKIAAFFTTPEETAGRCRKARCTDVNCRRAHICRAGWCHTPIALMPHRYFLYTEDARAQMCLMCTTRMRARADKKNEQWRRRAERRAMLELKRYAKKGDLPAEPKDVARCVEIKYSTRLQCARARQFGREPFGCASSTQRERSIRPKISRIDFELTEIESSEVWWGPPQTSG